MMKKGLTHCFLSVTGYRTPHSSTPNYADIDYPLIPQLDSRVQMLARRADELEEAARIICSPQYHLDH